MAGTPTKVSIRAYNVGFGDCFLLTFHYPDGGPRHVLVDFGTTKLPEDRGPKSMEQVAKQIAVDCGGKLQIVFATHRHADHISGFAGKAGKVIADLKPDLVVQPWTERPDLAPDAQEGPSGSAGVGGSGGSPLKPLNRAQALVARLADVHLVAELVLRDLPRLTASTAVPRTVIKQLEFLGADNLKNDPAVRALAKLGKPAYVQFGSKLALGTLLPGVKIDVLGPPTMSQSKGGVSSEARKSRTEFWHLAASSAATRLTRAAGKPIFPNAPTEAKFPQEARWVIPHIDRMSAEETLSLVRILDEVLNNTSLILLIEVGETSLLFGGDAQLENWSYALRDAPNAADIRARLAKTRLYKVGHHGSLNATPKTMLWELFERAGHATPEERLISLVSTSAGKHGSALRGTEVPRRPLVTELQAKTNYVTTQEGTSAKEFWRDVELPLS